jgi:hypothetical protein
MDIPSVHVNVVINAIQGVAKFDIPFFPVPGVRAPPVT